MGGFGGPPMGGLGPTAPMGGTPGMGDMGMGMGQGGFGGARGADFGGGGTAMAGPAPGGIGESLMDTRQNLNEDVDTRKIVPAQRKYDNRDMQHTPDDRTFMAQNRARLRPIATLKMIAKLRRSQMARRVEQTKRDKLIQKIYKAPPMDMGGGGLL